MMHDWLTAQVSVPILCAPLTSNHAANRQEIVFAGYNIENYSQASDFPDGSEKISKRLESTAAEIRISPGFGKSC